MLALPQALADHLDGGLTTLCRCWQLTRADGMVMGFTDHDRDIVFDGVTYAASAGLSPSEAEAQLGLAVSTSEVSGVLSSLTITEADIAAGLYDVAEVRSYLVNWMSPDQRILTDTATIGEIRRSEAGFVAELRGPMHRYDQEQGRLYTKTCGAELGDARCRIPLAAHTITVPVLEVIGALTLKVDLPQATQAHRFSAGRISFAAGANAGITRSIRHQSAEGVIELWETFPDAVAEGDGASLVAGCDKRFSTCQTVFGNAVNFRGFPDIPTPDFVLTYARLGEGGHDGGRLDP